MSHNAYYKKNRIFVYQNGAVLIFLAFILGLGAAAYLLKTFNAAKLQTNQDQKTYKELGEAKKALIAWAVSHPNTPGQMPFPDRNSDPEGYDGKSDCYTGVFQYSFLLGQLPIYGQTNPCVSPQLGIGTDFRDAQGNRLWYAVSRNLVRQYESPASDPIINPSIVNTPPYPWLQVLDRNGNLISNKVAAVIIAPGNPLGAQDRSAFAPNASEFLDSFQIGGTIHSNRGYATADEDFVIGEDSRNVSSNDTTFNLPYNFNDKLVFITIDELIAALEQRAANEIKNALLNYRDSASPGRPNGRGIGYFPYAARLGSSKDYACVTSNISGVLPIGTNPPANFTCSYSRAAGLTTSSCTTGFSNVNAISFQRSANNYTGQTGACSFNGRVCTCTGLGTCTRALQSFSCSAAGVCVANSNGTITFSGGEFTASTSPRCTLSCADAVCSGAGVGTATRNSCTDSVFNTGSSSLPAWIMTNKWYDYFYYISSRTGSQLLVGTKPNIDALLLGTNSPIITPYQAISKGSNQVRPSCNLNDHLDSVENANGNATFDAINTFRNHNYNDHSYIVAP